jgi:UDPglucose 6-dehydrogenase
MREALLLYIVKNLLEAGAIVKRYDPIAINKAKHQVGSTILYCKDHMRS